MIRFTPIFFFLVNLNNGFEQRLDVVSRRACSTRVRSKADSDHRTAHRISTCFRAPRFLNFRVFSQNIDNRLRRNKLSSKSEVESRTQGSRPRPRTQKKSEAKAKDSLSEDRHSRGQGQECSRPRPRTKDTSASALQKKKVFTKIFQAISTKKRFPKNFSTAPQNFNNSKNSAVLEPGTGQF